MLRSVQIALTTFTLLAVSHAQSPTQSTYSGRSWVGLLVPAACDKVTASAKAVSKATRESQLTVTDRTTTPAVDQSGTGGQSVALDPAANSPSGKPAMPQIGDVLSREAGKVTDPGWASAWRQARALGAACKIGVGTTSFGLLLADGSALAFDDLANQAIAKQLPALPTGPKDTRVFRVAVEGKLQGGKIALNSIRM